MKFLEPVLVRKVYIILEYLLFLICGILDFLFSGAFFKTKEAFLHIFGLSTSRSPWIRIPRSVELHGAELLRFEVSSTGTRTSTIVLAL